MITATNVEYMWNSVVLPRLGVAPYAWGGSFSPSDASVGTDCSGAVSAELGALVSGPAMVWPRQFYTGTFAGVSPGATGPFGGVPETSQLVCIASPHDAPPDAAMIIAVRQEADVTDAHMICQVQGVTIEMGGISSDYHTNVTNVNANSIFDTAEFNQWFFLPGLDPATPPPPAAILNPAQPIPVLYGIDISNNNFGGPSNPNLGMIPSFVAQVVREGFSFIEAKVSEGSGFADPTWTTVYKACQDNGIVCIAYHFIDTSSPTQQAQNCKAALNGADVPIMLDWEQGDGNTFFDVRNAFISAGLRVVLNYIPKWYWDQHGSPDLSGITGLVSSNWVNGSDYASNLYPGDSWAGWNAYGNATPVILQFTNQAQVAGMSLDADAFRGSLDDLKSILGTGDTPSMALTDAQQQDMYNGIMILLQAVTGNLNPPITKFLLPGSPTPVGANWGPDPNLGDQVNTLLSAVNSLNAAVAALSSDFQSTSTGLAVLKKLAELNSILQGSP